MNKKVWYIGFIALVVVISTGCGQKPQTASPYTEQEQQSVNSSLNESNAADPEVKEELNSELPKQPEELATSGAGQTGEEPNNASSGSTTPSVQSQTIDVYFTDPEQLELKTAQKKITYTDELDKYSNSYKALQTSDKDELIPLWRNIELRAVDFDKGLITLDITIPDTANLGSGGEIFALDALYQTFFQYEEVTAVEILVDGQKTESLMGHVELEHPRVK